MQLPKWQLSGLLILFILCFHLPACKHNHPVSESLKQAFEIHKDALKIASEVDSLAMALTDDSLRLSILQSKKEWFKNKISIEALEPHDHSKCNHDHESEIKISDEDMLLVQREWRDSIMALKHKMVAKK